MRRIVVQIAIGVMVAVVFSQPLLADVAPDPGFANVSANLILESDADLSGYRFFLESPMDVEEIQINSGAPTVIEAAGRGGAARYAKLIAVPLSDFGRISGELNESLIGSLIRRKQFPNATELLSHNFQVTVPIAQKPGWEHPVYRLSMNEGKISAAPIASDRADRGKLSYSIWEIFWPVALGAALVATAVAITGIWIIRRSSKKEL